MGMCNIKKLVVPHFNYPYLFILKFSKMNLSYAQFYILYIICDMKKVLNYCYQGIMHKGHTQKLNLITHLTVDNAKTITCTNHPLGYLPTCNIIFRDLTINWNIHFLPVIYM